MRLIPARYVDSWHKQIDAIAGDQSPITEEYGFNAAFPWSDARQYTTQHIANKKGRPTPEESDERLIKLIQKSTRKDVALAACTHVLSPQAIRTLMRRDFIRLDIVTYLKVIIIAHHGSSSAVDALEAERAKALLVAHETLQDDVGQYLKYLFEILKTRVPKESLVYANIHTEAIIAIPQLASELASLRLDNQWNRAWKMASWLSDIPVSCLLIPANHLNPIELLDRNFRGWRLWVAWRPGGSMISESNLNDIQRKTLRDLLALEGPDDQVNPKGTVCERLQIQGIEITSSVARVGSLSFQLEEDTQKEARAMLGRLFEIVDKASGVGSYHADLLVELCVGKVITHEALEILDGVAAAADGTVTSRVLRLYESRSKPKYDQIQSAKLVLSLLCNGRCGRLRKAVAPLLMKIVMADIEEMQHSLQTRWEAKLLKTEPTEVRLQEAVAELKAVAIDTSWFSATVDDSFMDLVKHWPTAEHLVLLQNIRTHLTAAMGDSATSLLDKTTGYFQDIFVKHGSITEDTRAMVRALISLWEHSPDLDRLSVAILIADGQGKFRTDCILQLHLLPNDYVLRLKEILQNWIGDSNQADMACVSLASLLASTDIENADAITCWRPVLYRMIKKRGYELVDNALKYLKVQEWMSFLRDIRGVFGDKVVWNPKLSPSIMRPGLHSWAEHLATHLPAIIRLEEAAGSRSAIQCILAGGDENVEELLTKIVCHLAMCDCYEETTLLCQAAIATASLLSRDLGNAVEVYEVLCSLFQVTQEGAGACLRLLEMCNGDSADVARVLFPGWLQDASSVDQLALKDTARLLGIGADTHGDISDQTMEAVADYMDARYAELLAEAQRLDCMRINLKAIDFEGTSQLLTDNEIEDTTAIEDAFARLPTELLNVVERVGDSEIEILFPLNNLTQLQRAAMGVGIAQSLLLRLQIGDYGVPPRFCIHLDNEPKLDSDSNVHSQWVVFRNSRAPELPVCHGKVTPATYQLARTLSRFLMDGFKSLQSIHALISKSLKTMGSECIVCGVSHGAMLRRATVCDAAVCKAIFARSSIEIRLADIRQDPAAVDMLLTMVNSAISSGYHHLLPGCPFDKDTVLKILRTMPAMETLQRTKYFTATVKRFSPQTENFLSWVCCSFRGFLSSATGPLRIPSLPPGTQQFILANATPLKEISFAAEIGQLPTRVVFHGTSLDRLFPIMCQGLKVMSGTPLQAYGAVSGPGIYLADEPSVSWAYADRAAAGRANWRGSKLKNGRVLLGCEHAGPPISTNGVHVVSKESTVMVRYIFLIPSTTATVPIAGHVAPAMLSVYNSLRSGAL